MRLSMFFRDFSRRHTLRLGLMFFRDFSRATHATANWTYPLGQLLETIAIPDNRIIINAGTGRNHELVGLANSVGLMC